MAGGRGIALIHLSSKTVELHSAYYVVALEKSEGFTSDLPSGSEGSDTSTGHLKVCANVARYKHNTQGQEALL